MADRVLPGPRSGMSEGDGGLDIIWMPILAGAQLMEAQGLLNRGARQLTMERFTQWGSTFNI